MTRTDQLACPPMPKDRLNGFQCLIAFYLVQCILVIAGILFIDYILFDFLAPDPALDRDRLRIIGPDSHLLLDHDTDAKTSLASIDPRQEWKSVHVVACLAGATFTLVGALIHGATRPDQNSAPFGLPVSLNVYHVLGLDTVKTINGIFASRYLPLKFGGIFHVAVEVDGVELSYGQTDTGTGISRGSPRSDPQHSFRQAIYQGLSPLQADDIKDIIKTLESEWHGIDYDELGRNCCHFADEFCHRLRVGGIPPWINRFALIGAGIRWIWLFLAPPVRMRTRTVKHASKHPCRSSETHGRRRSKCTIEHFSPEPQREFELKSPV